eukprot:26404_1
MNLQETIYLLNMPVKLIFIPYIFAEYAREINIYSAGFVFLQITATFANTVNIVADYYPNEQLILDATHARSINFRGNIYNSTIYASHANVVNITIGGESTENYIFAEYAMQPTPALSTF